METALTIHNPSLSETMELGNLLAQSGFFADSRGAAQAVVKVLAGRELGFGPIASMTGINIIQGRVSISANLMAAAIKRSGRYDYLVKEMTATRCNIEFRERVGDKWIVIGFSEFTDKDAQKAGTKNMDKFPRNMLFARAMSNGARWFTPDIFGGPVYTPEELGATVDGETGEVIDAPRIIVEQPAPTAPTAPSNGKQTPASDGDAKRLPFRLTQQAAIEWAMQTAPQVWPVDKDGVIVTKVVESSFAKLKTDGLHGEDLGWAWVAKVTEKLDTWQRSQAVRITDAELDGEPQPEGADEPGF